jgi:hypothetical protein
LKKVVPGSYKLKNIEVGCRTHEELRKKTKELRENKDIWYQPSNSVIFQMSGKSIRKKNHEYEDIDLTKIFDITLDTKIKWVTFNYYNSDKPEIEYCIYSFETLEEAKKVFEELVKERMKV